MGAAKSSEMASASTPGVNIGRLVDEAAERLGVKRSWTYERTRRKAIPHRRLGKFGRFTEQDIHAIADAAAIGDLH